MPQAIPDVVLVRPEVHGDARGYFFESWREREFAAAGIAARFVQDGESGSERGVLRGLHYQLVEPQGKLVRAVVGEVFDVAVDLRRSSPTFGRWVGAVLSERDRTALWIPPGFAHGFLTLSAEARVSYKLTAYYAPAHDRSLRWDDAALGIEWPLERIGGEPSLSAKDARAPRLADAETYA